MASSSNFDRDGDGGHRGVEETEANLVGELLTDGINQTDPGRAFDPVGGVNGNKGHPLLELPIDIWPQILQHFTQYEVVRSRLVCRKWKEIVNNINDFNVIVDEREVCLEGLSQMRIKKCKIWRLYSPNRFVPEWPMLLRSLELPGLINPAAFQLIVDSATKLEHLKIDLDGLVVRGEVPEELRGALSGLSNLRRLEIEDFNSKIKAPAIKAGNLSRILAHQMPFLETFEYCVYGRQDPSPLVQQELVQFLSRSPTVQQVNLCIRGDDVLMESSAVFPNWDGVISLPVLHTLDILCDTHFLSICAPLLNGSTHLKKMRIRYDGQNLGLPIQILSGPLLRNAASLVEVELSGLRLSTSEEIQPGQAPTPLDAGVFRDASNLRKLVLDRQQEDWKLYPDELPEQPNLINLWMLPSSLEVLDIERFSIQTEELEGVMPGLHKMKDLRLIGTGKKDGLGANRKLARLIALRLKIEKYILEPVINYWTSPEGVGGRVESDDWFCLYELQQMRRIRQHR